MLISPSYRDLNAKMHQERAGYGAGGWQWIGPVLHFMSRTASQSVLDYGCGKGTFAKWFPNLTGVACVGYDPSVPQFAAEPEPQDFVACLDVLEHIEPENLPTVLAHLRSKMRRGGLLVISTRKASKELADGRNAHLIVQKPGWWMERLRPHFTRLTEVPDLAKDCLVVFVEV